jgi:hypothetical protein
MLTRRLGWLLGLLTALSLTGAGWAAEAEKKEPKAKDPYRVIIGKVTAARQKLIKEKPELAEAYKAIRDKQKQVMEELKKELDDFYVKLRAMSPELDELEKQKEAIEGERQKEREAAMAEKKRQAEERRKKAAEKKPKKKDQ